MAPRAPGSPAPVALPAGWCAPDVPLEPPVVPVVRLPWPAPGAALLRGAHLAARAGAGRARLAGAASGAGAGAGGTASLGQGGSGTGEQQDRESGGKTA
ncbi:MAG: hypothetical protein PGN34_14545 [Methylobacterium frigidaeris]